MKNTREEEEEKLHYTTLNYKMEMKTTPKTLHIFALKPWGGIYSHQGRGGQGTGPSPKRGRGRGRTAARAALRAARGPVCPMSGPVPVFGLQPLVLTDSAL